MSLKKDAFDYYNNRPVADLRERGLNSSSGPAVRYGINLPLTHSHLNAHAAGEGSTFAAAPVSTPYLSEAPPASPLKDVLKASAFVGLLFLIDRYVNQVPNSLNRKPNE